VTAPYLHQSHAAAVAFAIMLTAFGLGELSQAMRLRRGAHTVDLLGEVWFRLLFVAAVLTLPLCLSVAPGEIIPGRFVLFVLGSVFAWLGLLLRWWSILVLGRYFTVVVRTSADQVVVERGPYRVLRHPSYTGLLVALTGVGLVLANWVGALASLALMLAALVYRIRIEERALLSALGEGYLNFARGRARLVPFVW
jgi:protein-S-isoprenylcysteine O-methyltransferase Ste14